MTIETVNQPILNFSSDSLKLQVEQENDRILDYIRETVHYKLRRQGAVVGISGGIDSSVVLGLCARALGPEKVIGILLPEKESSPESIPLAHSVAECFQVKTVTEDITPALEGFGCYTRRNEAIRRVFPQYQPGWKVRIALPVDLLQHGTLNIFKLIITDPSGNEISQRLPISEYYQIVASSNFKQRTRTNMLYYHAELRNYAMVGTPNKNEHDLGFFVKFGDGGYDLAPIRHLFKTQVYQLAEYLNVPEEVLKRMPSTDTYPGGGSQEEFFYRIPFAILDTIWFGYEQGVQREMIASALKLKVEQVDWVIEDIQRKEKTTQYLRMTPLGL